MNDKVVCLPLGKTMYSTFHDEGTGGVALVDNPSIYNWYLNEVMNITCIRGFVNTYTSPLVRVVGSSIWDNPYLDRIHYLIKFDEKTMQGPKLIVSQSDADPYSLIITGQMQPQKCTVAIEVEATVKI